MHKPPSFLQIFCLGCVWERVLELISLFQALALLPFATNANVSEKAK